MMRTHLKAYIYLVASLMIGSFTPALLVITNGQNLLEIFLLSALISVPISLALVIWKDKLADLRGLLADKNKLFYMAVAAVLAYATFGYGIAYAEQFIGAPLTTVLFRLNPLLMLLFLPFVLRERLSAKQILALGLSFAGIVIALGSNGLLGGNFGANSLMMGVVVFLALGFALSSIIIKKQMIDNDVYLCGAAIALSLFYALFFLASNSSIVALSNMQVGLAVYIALTNVFSFGMFTYALKMLKTTIVTNTYMLSPFLTFVWAGLLFGSPILPSYMAIAILCAIGILIQRSDNLGGSYLKHGKSASDKIAIFDVTGAFIEGDDAIKRIIVGGGRVFAAKMHPSKMGHIESMINENLFSNIYKGEEAIVAKEAQFVKDILGLEDAEAMVIKAGAILENDRFFEALENRMSVD